MRTMVKAVEFACKNCDQFLIAGWIRGGGGWLVTSVDSPCQCETLNYAQVSLPRLDGRW